MRRIVMATLLHALGFIGIANGQTDEHWQNLDLIGTLTPPLGDDGQIKITIVPSNEPFLCTDGLLSLLCSTDVRRGATAARIEIHKPGYKTYITNVPRLIFIDDIARVNIGTVTLTKSDLPTVQRVVAGHNKGSRVFELTLMNKLLRDVLITSLKVEAYSAGSGRSCETERMAVYEIAGRLTVTGGGKGDLNARGKYREKVRGSDYVVDTSAQVEQNSCNQSARLNLSLPTSFVIPRDSFSAIRIIVPKTFTVVSKRVLNRPLPPVQEDHLGRFTIFRFGLSTGETDELDIVATYSSDPTEVIKNPPTRLRY